MLSASAIRNYRNLSRAGRERGLALLVVMVVFVILYLVVVHLEFWTKTEERVAKVRQTDAQAQDAMHSIGLFVMALLTEDYVQDLQELSGGASGAAGASGMPGGGMDGALAGLGAGAGAGAGGPGAGGPGRGLPAAGDATSSGSNFVPIGGAGAGAGGPTVLHYDYVRENIFQDVLQEIGEVSIKARITDNERGFDLNLLFEYAKLVLKGSLLGGEMAEEELLGLGGEDPADAESLAEAAAGRGSRNRIGNDAGVRAGRAARGGETEQPPAEADALAEQLGLQQDVELTQFVAPTPEVLAATERMLERAIEAVVSMNEDWGFQYHERVDSITVARGIVEYVLARRQSTNAQNIIYHSSELLNIPTVTPELYYGPAVPIADGETFPVETPGQWGFYDLFELHRDEFGDYIATAIVDEFDQFQREEEALRLEELQSMWGPFAEFAGIGGVGRLAGSALTRGMEEPAVIYDEEGNGYIPRDPLPIGLKDIFCTFSTGKINLNTATFPVLYGLLLSLDEGAGGDASHVATKIVDYRNRLQDFAEDETSTMREQEQVPTVDRGQPRRERPVEEDEALLTGDELALDEAGSAYADIETNYFTNLQQIELIDGSDQGPDDILRSDVGVDRVSAEEDSLLQKVLNDFGSVMVFGSTYFTVELKARIKTSPIVKKGYLIVKRDTETRMLEVILWKEFQ